MKIVVKPTTKDFKSYQEKGVHTFLFPLRNFSSYQNVSFTLDELKQIRNDYDFAMYVLLDKNVFEEELSELDSILAELETLSIDGLFFYDLGVLELVLEKNYRIPLVFHQNFLGTNAAIYDFYYSFGVGKGVLPLEITMDEIKEIVDNSKMSFVLPVFGYPLIAFSKRNFVRNYLQFMKEEDSLEKHFFKEKDRCYPIIENESGTALFADQMISFLPYLEKLDGISEILCDETAISHDLFLKVLGEYNCWIEHGCVRGEEYAKNIAKFVVTSSGFLNKKTIYKVKK